jgi:hypothetical protein
MTDYASVRSNWWALLDWHVRENGTRPDGTPDTMGDPWEDAEFALACGVGDSKNPDHASRTVQNWFDEGRAIVTRNIKPIEKALMGKKPVYEPWRKDLREAHKNARRGRKSDKIVRMPLRRIVRMPEFEKISDEPVDREAFAFLVRQGLLMRLKGTIFITQDFFYQLWLQCCYPELISAIISPDQELQDGELLLHKFLALLLVPAVQTDNQSVEELNTVAGEAVYHFHRLFLRKSHELGLLVPKDGKFFIDDDTVDYFADNLFTRRPDSPTKSDVYYQTYEAWKDVVGAAVERALGEDTRYTDILALFMYSISYDEGSIAHCATHWEGWKAEITST